MHEQIYSGTNNFACKCYVFKLDALKQAKMPKEEEVDQVNQPTNILKASLEFLPVGGTRLATGSCWNVDDMKKLLLMNMHLLNTVFGFPKEKQWQ